MLFGKLANLGDDISDSFKEDVAIFKKIATGESIKAENKGKDAFQFIPYAKLIFSATISLFNKVFDLTYVIWLVILSSKNSAL